MAVLHRLPARRLEDFTRQEVRVSPFSTIRVSDNTYSVHSRLIGERVPIRLYADHLDVYYAQRHLERIPRLRGKGGHHIQYRHIIDGLGYVQHSRQEMEVLFNLLAHRYERGSVMITSNLPFSQWEEIFKDPMTTAAAIDRLVHHSVVLELNVPSYRLEEFKKRRAA